MCLTLFTVSRTPSIAMQLLSVLAAFTVKEGTEAELFQTASCRLIPVYSVQTVYRRWKINSQFVIPVVIIYLYDERNLFVFVCECVCTCAALQGLSKQTNEHVDNRKWKWPSCSHLMGTDKIQKFLYFLGKLYWALVFHWLNPRRRIAAEIDYVDLPCHLPDKRERNCSGHFQH